MRKKFDDVAGAGQEFTAHGTEGKQRIEGAESSLTRKHGILVHHGIARSTIDVGDFIHRQRKLRGSRCTEGAA